MKWLVVVSVKIAHMETGGRAGREGRGYLWIRTALVNSHGQERIQKPSSRGASGMVAKSSRRGRLSESGTQSRRVNTSWIQFAGGPVASLCPWRGAKTSQSNVGASEKIGVL